jgi:hypothetical protein
MGVYSTISEEKLFWDVNTISHTNDFMAKLFDVRSNVRLRRIQNSKRRTSDPISQKYEGIRREKSIGRGLANAFLEGND